MEPALFDVLDPVPLPCPVEALLCGPLRVGANDQAEFVRLGWTTHLGRPRRCGWHLMLHRDPDRGWTHLYRAVAEPGGGVAVLLDRALAGDARERLRREAGLHKAGTGPARLPPSDPRPGLRG